MKWYKFHELNRWSEYHIFRAQQAAKMRGQHSDEEWARIFADHQAPPPPPVFRIALDEAIELTSITPASQLELGVAAMALSNWAISNARDVFDPRLPLRLWPLIGSDAFTKPNSWRRRVFRQKLLIARADQKYVAGWDRLRAALADDLNRTYTVGDINKLSITAISATLDGDEARDFWRANR